MDNNFLIRVSWGQIEIGETFFIIWKNKRNIYTRVSKRGYVETGKTKRLKHYVYIDKYLYKYPTEIPDTIMG